MRKYKKKLKKHLADIKCDICKKSCVTTDISDDILGIAEFATLEAIWGYFSRKDGEKYNCEMCEDCFDKVYKFIENLKDESASKQ